MEWFKTCLKNKLLVYIGAIAICLAGLFSIYKAPLVPFTGSSSNEILVNIMYPGANAQTISAQILKQLTPELQTINHIQNIQSTAKAGQASIELRPQENISDLTMTQTEMQVMQVVSSANLPSSIPTPSVQLVGGGMSGVIDFEVTSKHLSVFELNNFVQAILYPKFSAIPGLTIFSSSDNPEVAITLDPAKLAQYKLNPLTVAETLNANTQFDPLGDIFVKQQDYPLNLGNNISSLYSFKHLLVGYTLPTNTNSNATPNYFNGLPIYLQNLGQVSFIPTPSAYQPYSNFNGEQDAGIYLNTRNNANPLTVSKETRSFLDSIKDTLPSDLTITPTFDMSTVVMNSIREVAITIFIACILVIIVAFVFLGRLRTTLISLVAIPICLLGALTFIYAIGDTINILTLLALVIAVGLVVDDAIVVVENITRYIEMGYKRYDAVIEGTASIAMTIIGITLTLLAVYLPLTFIDSNVVNLIKPFAVTLAAAVFISGIVALTVTPVVAYALVTDAAENRYQLWFHKVLSSIINVYHNILKTLLTYSKTALFFIVIILAIGGFFALKLPMQVFPADPDGAVEIDDKTTPSDTLETVKKKLALFEKFYKDPRAEYYSEVIAPNRFTATQALMGNIEIKYGQDYLKQITSIVDSINQYIKTNHIKNAHAHMSKFFNNGNDYDISFYFYSAGSTAQNNALATKLAKALAESPVFSSAEADVQPAKKQLSFNINEERALSVGISRSDITSLLSTYYGGYRLHNDFSIDGLTVPVRVTIDLKDMRNPKSLDKLMIHSNLTNHDYPLSEFVSMKLIAQPEVIQRFNGLASVEMDLNINKGYAMGQAIKAINNATQSVTPNAQIYYIDSAKMYLQGSSQTILITLLGLACIYFLLTILFKNLADPLIILLTVPCTVIGGALSLYLIGGSINVYSTLGLITLIGLITKHGILIVRFANDELLKGKMVIEATLEATKQRFRPIMMTTLAMVMGALPLLLSDKIIYVSRQNLAIVIIGGLLIGTLFSLVIIPVVYKLIKQAEQAAHH